MATLRVRARMATIIALFVALASLAGAESADAAGDPAVDSQQLVYEINLARWNPAAYIERSGNTSFPNGTLARPPMALNPDLAASAAFKANEIADNGYFAHQSAVTGKWPNELARDHGYQLPTWFSDDTNNIESLHGGSPDPFAVLGSFAGSPSHAKHIFGGGGFAAYDEVGVGRSSNLNYWAVHSAQAGGTDQVFVTGVVYDDLDGNGRMDLGEGIGGVGVTAGTASTVTNAGGGYALHVTPGTITVVASGLPSATVTVAQHNVGVDFVVGDATPIVRAYQLCQGLEPTILGTNRDDVLHATEGVDVIHGLGGDDTVVGLSGDDIACGVGVGGTEGSTEAPSGGDTVVTVAADGRWYRRDSLASSAPVQVFYYGNPGDVPFTGDWDGDGLKTPGLFRQSDGFAYLRRSNTQGNADITFFFGNPGDVPIVGDYDGDGRDTLAIYRPSQGRVYIINKLGIDGGGLGAADFWFELGNPGDQPFVGDFDGDGIDTIGMYRPPTGQVFLLNSLAGGAADVTFSFGNAGDVMIAGDWDGDGVDTVAAYRRQSGTIHFKLRHVTGPADYSLTVGSYAGAAGA